MDQWTKDRFEEIGRARCKVLLDVLMDMLEPLPRKDEGKPENPEARSREPTGIHPKVLQAHEDILDDAVRDRWETSVTCSCDGSKIAIVHDVWVYSSIIIPPEKAGMMSRKMHIYKGGCYCGYVMVDTGYMMPLVEEHGPQGVGRRIILKLMRRSGYFTDRSEE